MLATRRFLIQEVVDDEVIPNVSTDNQAALAGGMAMAADVLDPTMPAPSAAITTSPMTNKFLTYDDVPADGGSGSPGNTFAHPSLLGPRAQHGGRPARHDAAAARRHHRPGS